MQATIELSDPLFHAVEATAARQGVRLNDFISEALQDKLAKSPSSAETPHTHERSLDCRNRSSAPIAHPEPRQPF